jgi:imidazolonepropionase-like amidohydrolase
LEAGKIADALVVNGDPLQDLAALQKIRLVIYGGIVVLDSKQN